MKPGTDHPAWRANQQRTSRWSTAEIGEAWTIPPEEKTRADVCRAARRAEERTGRRFRVTAEVDRRRNGVNGTRLESPTRVERIS